MPGWASHSRNCSGLMPGWASHSRNCSGLMPGARETRIWRSKSRASLRLRIMSSICQGSTAKSTRSASWTAAQLSVVVRIPRAANFSSVVVWRAVTVMSEGVIAPLRAKPFAVAPPMLPAPMMVIFMVLWGLVIGDCLVLAYVRLTLHDLGDGAVFARLDVPDVFVKSRDNSAKIQSRNRCF